MASRSVTGAQVRRWGLGFAADGRLAGRIVVPVRDGRGRVCSYQARTFVNDRVRYLTPRKDENPDVTVLFGEEHWPVVRGRVFVTEGAFDALAVERVTGGAVAVLSGVAHATDGLLLAKLSTFAEVVIATDANPAGEMAWRELYAGLVRHVRVRRVGMPTGQDANSMSAGELAEVLG
jgi:DNA primase